MLPMTFAVEKIEQLGLGSSRSVLERAAAEFGARGYAVANVGMLTPSQFLNLAYMFGEVVPPGRNCELVTTIVTKADSGEQIVPLHNDKSYWSVPPKVLLFYISSARDMSSGNMLLSDILSAFRTLSAEAQTGLVNDDLLIFAPKNRDPRQARLRVINHLNGELAFFRFREDIVTSGPAIAEWFGAAAQQSFTCPLTVGSLLVLNNWTMAHGREQTTFFNNGERTAFRALVL